MFDLIGEIDISLNQADDMYTNQTCTIRKDRSKKLLHTYSGTETIKP